jgi:hypothetical protein
MRISFLMFLLFLTSSIDVFSQESIPDSPHTRKLQALVGRSIWFAPHFGCLDKISKRNNNGETERFIPEKPSKIEIKALRKNFDYKFDVQSESGFNGEAEANLIEGGIRSEPHDAITFYNKCYFPEDPALAEAALRKREFSGFKYLTGYSPESREEEIKR